MQQFTRNRGDDTEDEIWLVEHEQVFTLGMNSKAEHLLNVGDIPCVQTERGGQVTFHGPGQIVAYLLLDLRRAVITVRALVCLMEAAIIETLSDFEVLAYRKDGVPGVYVSNYLKSEKSNVSESFPSRGLATDSKIASLGIRVSRGCTYHGLALNVDMNLEPFSRINPCGFPGLKVTDLKSERNLVRSRYSQEPPFIENGEHLQTCIQEKVNAYIKSTHSELLLTVSERLGRALKNRLTSAQQNRRII
jgi:lipoyl(octanoyl) transferase